MVLVYRVVAVVWSIDFEVGKKGEIKGSVRRAHHCRLQAWQLGGEHSRSTR